MCARATNSMFSNFTSFGPSFTVSWVIEEFNYQTRQVEIKNKVLKSVNFNKITFLTKKNLGKLGSCHLLNSITINEGKITANKRSLLFHPLTRYRKEENQNRGIDKTKTAWLHPFSTYAEFSEKLTFLTADTPTCVCVSGGKKC